MPHIGKIAAGSAGDHVFVTARQLAIMLQVSRSALGRLRSAGRLPAPVPLGAVVRWRLDDVTRWIDEGCPKQAER